jgi:hypothetical protein
MNNPGGYTALENGTTEPEADDPDEEEGVVELLDVVQAAVWLDDGDNYQDGGESPLLSGSLGTVLDALNSGNGVRIDGQDLGPSDDGGPTDLTTFGVNRFDVDGDGTYGADIELVADPVDSGKVARATSGGSATADYVTSSVSLPADITISDVNSSGGLTYDYYEGADNERAAPDEVILLLSDDTGTRRVVSRTWNDGDGASSSWATREVGLEITDDFGANSGRNWIEVTGPASAVNLGANLTSDADISGSSEVLAMAVARGNSDPSVSRNLDVYYRDPTVQNGEYNLTFPTACFRGETDFSAAFAWWVPVDHGNEIQSDSVEFDLGFYTEQCRHNDGSGMPTADVGTGSGFPEADLGDFTRPSPTRARARNGGANTEELAIASGSNPFASGNRADVDWAFPIEGVEWTLSYDSGAGEAAFEIAGTTVTQSSVSTGDFDGRLLVTAKANEATVGVSNLALSVGGSSVLLNGSSSIEATNDGSDRDIQYAVIDAGVDGSEDFELSGTASVSKNDGFSGDEGWAIDIFAE